VPPLSTFQRVAGSRAMIAMITLITLIALVAMITLIALIGACLLSRAGVYSENAMIDANRGLRVGAVARLTGVSSATIRHYERLGLIPRAHRTASGYRVYGPGAVDRVKLVRGGVRFGFTLRQLAGFMRVRDSGGAPCTQVRAAGQQILVAADRELAQLIEARAEIAQTLQDWDRRLASANGRGPARLLEALPEGAQRETRRHRF
jgi:DNA-binding transcriptional MerR regulator